MHGPKQFILKVAGTKGWVRPHQYIYVLHIGQCIGVGSSTPGSKTHWKFVKYSKIVHKRNGNYSEFMERNFDLLCQNLVDFMPKLSVKLWVVLLKLRWNMFSSKLLLIAKSKRYQSITFSSSSNHNTGFWLMSLSSTKLFEYCYNNNSIDSLCMKSFII